MGECPALLPSALGHSAYFFLTISPLPTSPSIYILCHRNRLCEVVDREQKSSLFPDTGKAGEDGSGVC